MGLLKVFYSEEFCGIPIADHEFDRLARIAKDVIYDVCNRKPTSTEQETDEYRTAVCYQIEMIHQQGGVDAVNGFAESLTGITSESLGGYSVSGAANAKDSVLAKNGVPVSSIAISQLRKLGLMSRWLYSGVRRGDS